jgi:CHAT domain-containing protein/tetratricopeptide (TPR) repeat protein
MPGSYGERIGITCPSCHRKYEVDVWWVIAIDDRPDLIDALLNGRLNDAACPHCGHAGTLPTPLLIYIPGDLPHGLFIPRRGSTQEEESGQLDMLVGTLRESLAGAATPTSLAIHRFDRDGLAERLAAFLQGDDDHAAAPASANRDLPPEIDTLARLQAEYDRTGDGTVLDRMIVIWEGLLASPSFADRPSGIRHDLLTDVARTFMQRYELAGSRRDLDEALELFGRAHALAANPKQRATACNNLGGALRHRYSALDDVADLERSIEYLQHGLAQAEITPDTHAFLHTNLGIGLRLRYLRYGRVEDLDSSVHAYTEAVRIAPPGQLSGCLNNLGNGLMERFHRSGDFGDLDRAIQAYAEALKNTPEGSPRRPYRFNNLGLALHQRYGHSANPADHQYALQCIREAVRLTRLGAPERAARLTNLAMVLLDEERPAGDMATTDEATAALNEALSLTPDDSPYRDYRIALFGSALLSRYHATQREDDLHELIRTHESLLASNTPYFWRDRCLTLNTLATALTEREQRSGDRADWDRAAAHWRTASQHALDVAAEAALTTSQNWGRHAFARGDWAGAIEAYGYAQDAIDRLYQTQLTRAQKQRRLAQAQSIPVQLAYAIARTDAGESSLRRAVEVLEHGRVRLLTEALERQRSDLDALAETGHKELLDNYSRASASLSQLQNRDTQRETSTRDALQGAAAVVAAREELAVAIAAIRRVAGYEDFFTSPKFDDIHSALGLDRAGERRVATFLMSTLHGGLALVVDAASVHAVWLQFSEADLAAMLSGQAAESGSGYAAIQNGREPDGDELTELATVLGERVIGPIVENLNRGSARERQHVILLPMGRLSQLPFHAARYHDGPTERTFLDDCLVSYAPSARTLRDCRNGIERAQAGPPTFLGIGNPLPLPESIDALEFARAEVECIGPLFDAGARLLCESDATLPTVESALPGCTYAHFSCHGFFDAAAPLTSGLLLAGGERLSIGQLIAGRRLRQTRLAVLSACQTAITDTLTLPEEAVGLPAALIQTGVCGVIGTLWPVNDFSTAVLMIRLYESMTVDRLKPAEALRRAQGWLRDASNTEIERAYIAFMARVGQGRPASPAIGPLAEDIAAAAREAPSERSFADPYYWAPFVFIGE